MWFMLTIYKEYFYSIDVQHIWGCVPLNKDPNCPPHYQEETPQSPDCRAGAGDIVFAHFLANSCEVFFRNFNHSFCSIRVFQLFIRKFIRLHDLFKNSYLHKTFLLVKFYRKRIYIPVQRRYTGNLSVCWAVLSAAGEKTM